MERNVLNVCFKYLVFQNVYNGPTHLSQPLYSESPTSEQVE